MRIKYIFLFLCSYILCRINALSKKLFFGFVKKKHHFKSEGKTFWNDFFVFDFVASTTCHIFNI
jgi:hypothetical protein